MKKLVVLLLVSLMAGSAFAVQDSDVNSIGVYFDLTADTNALTIGANTPFNAYVCITNPSEAEVHGLEFGYEVVVPAGMSGLIFRLANNLPAGSVDIGNNASIFSGDYVTGLAQPLAGTASVPFVSWTFMILAPMSLDFYITESQIPSLPQGGPAYEAGGYIVGLSQSTGGSTYPVARVNGEAPVAVETASFGTVKSLFR